ncbi:MAG: hypothetical protein Q4C91_00915 [Eubacteriales bacterium]|nr:hypothetical protein [Eubacteriales bacterium]
MLREGTAVLIAYFENPEDPGTTETRLYTITVADDQYESGYDYENGTNKMLKGRSMRIHTSLYWRGYNPETEEYNERNVDNYSLEFGEYDSDLDIQLDVTDIIITSEVSKGYNIPVQFVVDGNAVSEEEIWVEVTDGGYYVISRGSIAETDLYVGESTTVNPEIKFYNEDYPDGKEIENYDSVEYRWGEYNDEAVEISNKTAPFKITKLKNWDEDVTLTAIIDGESGTESEPITWNLRGQEYDVSFGEERPDRIYEDGDVEIVLNTEGLSGEYKVKWEVGFDNEGNINSFEKGYEISKQQNSITLLGDKLSGILGDGDVFKVRAVIEAGGEEVSRDEMDIEYCDVVIEKDFDFPEDGSMSTLPRYEQYIRKQYDGWLRNSEYPDGTNCPIQIQDVSSSNEDVVTVRPDNGNGWNIIPNKNGNATITVEYSYEYENESKKETTSFEILVGTDIYNVTISSNTNATQVLPGAALKLTADIRHEYYDVEQDRHFSDEGENVRVEWKAEQESDAVTLSVDSSDSRKVTVTAKDETSGRDVKIVAQVFDQEGNSVAEEEFWLNISNEYYEIFVDEELNSDLLINNSVNITPTLRLVKSDGNSNNVDTEIRYCWEWDSNAFEIKDSEGNILTDNALINSGQFTIRRKESWGKQITLIANMKDEDEHWCEVARKTWNFKQKDYNISMENLREQDYTWVYSDEDYVINLDMTELEGIQDVTPIIEVVIQNEETWDSIKTSGAYEVNGSSVTLHGAVLKEVQDQLKSGEWLAIQARIEVNGSEIANYGVGFDVRDPYYDLGVYDDMNFLPKEELVFSKDGKTIWVENQDYPNGADVKCTVENITSSDSSVFETVQKDGDWIITAKNPGSANITVKMSYPKPDGSVTTFEQTFNANVKKLFYDISIDLDTKTNEMLPGASVRILPEVYKFEAGTDGAQKLSPSEYKITYKPKTENEDMLTVGSDGTVQAAKDAEGEAYVILTLEIPSKDGGEQYKQDYTIYFNITSEYMQWQVDDIIAEPGSTVNLSDIKAVLIKYNKKNPNGIKMDVKPVLSTNRVTDTNLLEINGAGDAITVKGSNLTAADSPMETYIAVKTPSGEYEHWIKVTVCVHDYKVISSSSSSCVSSGSVTYECSKCGKSKTETTGTSGHSWSEWKTTTAATVFSPAIQTSYCYVCGTTITRTYGDKLDPTIDGATETLEVEPGQKVTDYKITGMANGDSVVSWESSAEDIVAVNGKEDGTCEIIVKNKTGEAEITITLKSGLKKIIKVSAAYSIQRTEPMIKRVDVSGNKIDVILSDTVKGATGYDYVISTVADYKNGRLENGINKNIPVTKTSYQYLPKGTYYVYCHAWNRVDGKKVFSQWSNIRQFTITATTPETPVVTSVKVKGSTVTVTWKKTADTVGYDVVLGKATAKVSGEKRPVKYGTLVKKNIKGDTVTAVFKNVPKGTYYAGLHAFNRTSEDNKKVFSPWSNIKTVKVK